LGNELKQSLALVDHVTLSQCHKIEVGRHDDAHVSINIFTSLFCFSIFFNQSLSALIAELRHLIHHIIISSLDDLSEKDYYWCDWQVQ